MVLPEELLPDPVLPRRTIRKGSVSVKGDSASHAVAMMGQKQKHYNCGNTGSLSWDSAKCPSSLC